MAKSKTAFICENCGHHEPRWTGKCPKCGEWNTFVEQTVMQTERKILHDSITSDAQPAKISEILVEKEQRISTLFSEFDRVLGGGLVSEEVVLLSGEPGVGKSTLLMQTVINLARDKRILYVSGEESSAQVANRARRIAPKDILNEIMLVSTASLQQILFAIDNQKPEIVVLDSIQTVYDEESSGMPGGLTQVRSCATKLIHHVKQSNIILLIVGHINKEGKIAGPKVLEHLVDCVLQFEGDANSYRVLRALKNRFGPTGEVGIFSMESKGLADLDLNQSNIFSSQDTEKEIGTAKTLVVEGDRPILLDIQALASRSVYAYPKRVAEGISIARMQLLAAIIDNFSLGELSALDLYIKTSGNYQLREYAYSDLAVVYALLSATNHKPLRTNILFLGEIGLNGRVTLPANLSKFLSEIRRVHTKYTIVTAQAFIRSLSSKEGKDLDLIGLDHVSEIKKLSLK